jgi:ankyrin repeat protein
MDSQPKEILSHILSYLTNFELLFAQLVSKEWQIIIESKFFFKEEIPTVANCIITEDYYHFGKIYVHNIGKSVREPYVSKGNHIQQIIRLTNNKIFMKYFNVQNKTIDSKEEYPTLNELLRNCLYEDITVIKFLVDKGADIYISNPTYFGYNNPPIKTFVTFCHFDAVKYLVELVGDNDDFYLILEKLIFESVKQMNTEHVKYLIDKMNNNFVIRRDKKQVDFDLLFKYAVYRDRLETAQFLFDKIDFTNACYNIMFKLSTEKCHLKMILFLFEKHQLIGNYQPIEDPNLLIDATDLLETLDGYHRYATWDHSYVYNENDKLFVISAIKGDIEKVKYLFELITNESIKKNSMKMTAINGHLDIVKYLFEKGVDIEFEDGNAISGAVINNNINIVRYFMEIYNEDHYQKNKKLQTNELLCILYQNTNIYARRYSDTIEYASLYNHNEMVKLLLTRNQLDTYNHINSLAYAVNQCNYEITKMLIDHNPKININSDIVKTCSLRGHIEIMKLLLNNGVDIHVDNDCALRNAASQGFVDMVRFLLENGADPKSNNNEALKWAIFYEKYYNPINKFYSKVDFPETIKLLKTWTT